MINYPVLPSPKLNDSLNLAVVGVIENLVTLLLQKITIGVGNVNGT